MDKSPLPFEVTIPTSNLTPSLKITKNFPGIVVSACQRRLWHYWFIFCVEYCWEFESEFEKDLGYVYGVQMGSFLKKTRDQKSRATVPLSDHKSTKQVGKCTFILRGNKLIKNKISNDWCMNCVCEKGMWTLHRYSRICRVSWGDRVEDYSRKYHKFIWTE